MAKFTIITQPDGTITAQTAGYAGPKCQDVTKFLEKAFGTVVSDEKTSEYFAEEEAESEVQTEEERENA